MATPWVLTKGMATLRKEFDILAPLRDKASDGTVGDLAHQKEAASGHNPDITGAAEYRDGDKLNEVRAVDIDSDLRTPSLTMEIVVQHLVLLGRAGKLAKWVRYMIYNGRIWAASDGWKTRSYTGASKHTEHLHVSGAYTQTADNNTNGAVFEFERIPVALTSQDKTWLKTTIDASVKENVLKVLQQDGTVTAPANSSGAATNPSWGLANTLTDIASYVRNIKADTTQLTGAETPPPAA